MKKIIICVLAIICVFACAAGVLDSTIYAGKDGYSWYCVHVKNHKQPTCAPELRFIEDNGGIYLDHSAGKNDEKIVYLTFDAGYDNGNVDKIVDILNENGIKGTFFILGNLVTRNTGLVKKMVEGGHLVCNHTYSHKDMSLVGDKELFDEIEKLEKVYKEMTGCEMAKFYRPPEGRFSQSNMSALKERGYTTVFWSFAYADWDNGKQMDKEKAKKIVLDNIHNGEIMLLHPTSATNVAILPEIIAELKSQGYRFGLVNEIVSGGD